MTWEIASLLILAVVLGVGIVWYERSKPGSKMLAMVATLAALAVLGRLAFGPLPNVKPAMTDIILLSGYTLGGAPAFAIGATAALASNIIFGQGPWTPWQMAGWGLVGVFGAVLRRLFGRDLGRWSLAFACLFAGLMFGMIMDFQSWALYSGQHTFAQLVAQCVGSLPFNIAHAVGNFVFCLAFGPAFVRTLERFRTRLTIRWKPILVSGAMLMALAPAVAIAATNKSAATRGAVWLAKGQPAGGGQGADTVAALRAAGSLSASEATTRAAVLRAEAEGYTRTAGATAKTILGLVAAGSGNPRCAGDIDLYDRLTGFAAGGRYGRTAWDQALGMLALRSLGAKPPSSTARFLLSTRAKGGWNFTLSKTARDDVTHTALAIMALRAAGVKSSNPGLRAAVKWMLTQRTPAGGFAHQRKDRNEANATALAVEALRSIGRRDARGLKALRALQRPDGAFQFTASDSGSRGLATVDAVVALSGDSLPVATRSSLPAGCK